MRLPRTGELSRADDPRLIVRREVQARLAILRARRSDDGAREPASHAAAPDDLRPLVLVACSGGPDSLALAATVAGLVDDLGLRAGAVIIDHGLQPGSAHVAAAAATTCRSLGLDPVEVLAVTFSGDGGPEAAARTARHDALVSAASRHGAQAVLLGHTRDDQAETVLLRLARGSGARSLAGIPPVTARTTADGRDVLWLRPLLALDRQVVRRSLDLTGLVAWTDPHNADPAYARARVRHDLLPMLAEALGPGVVAGLARSADLLRADAEALDGWAARVLDDAVAAAGGPPALADDGAAARVICLDPQVVAAVPAAVRTRVLRRAALLAGASAGALTSDHVQALDALVADWHGQGEVALPGARAWRRHGTLALAPT